MNSLGTEQLGRKAYVYVRQSTPDQVQHHTESQRRQYGLVDRARALGFAEVEVIDEDLGRSAAGIARPGFERLLAAICRGEAGAVVSIEASRLARNGRDWHTLLEFCALVGTVIIDEEGTYDPRLPNDRLLLGMKGTLSEMELSVLRQRAHEALLLKARRGELHTNVAVGYVRAAGDRLEKDPDRRVQEAIELVFSKFASVQSVRQVLLWLRQEGIALPAVHHGVDGRTIVWQLPGYPAVHKLLTNPVYAGAYVFGRTASRIHIESSRKRIVRGVRRSPEQRTVLIRDHHETYIRWEIFERNQRLIADNGNMKGEMVRGAVRRGEGLLAGLLRCRRCARKLHVGYSGTAGRVARYHCRGAHINHGVAERCLSFGALRIDAAVGTEVLRLLQPEGIAAALAKRSGNSARRPADSAGRWNSPWSRPASKPRGPAASTTPSTPITGWWRANWSDAGMSAWPKSHAWSWRSPAQKKRCQSHRKVCSENACSPSGQTWSRCGPIRGRAPRSVSGSCVP